MLQCRRRCSTMSLDSIQTHPNKSYMVWSDQYLSTLWHWSGYSSLIPFLSLIHSITDTYGTLKTGHDSLYETGFCSKCHRLDKHVSVSASHCLQCHLHLSEDGPENVMVRLYGLTEIKICNTMPCPDSNFGLSLNSRKCYLVKSQKQKTVPNSISLHTVFCSLQHWQTPREVIS